MVLSKLWSLIVYREFCSQIALSFLIEKEIIMKNKMKLTDRKIDKLPIPKSGVAYHWCADLHGLFVEVKSTGKKVYKAKITKGRFRNKQKSFGTTDDLNLAQARELAVKFLSDLTVNPSSNVQKIKNKYDTARRLSDAYHSYMARQFRQHGIDASDRPSTWRPRTVNHKRLMLKKLINELDDPLVKNLSADDLELWMQDKHYNAVAASEGELAAYQKKVMQEDFLAKQEMREPKFIRQPKYRDGTVSANLTIVYLKDLLKYEVKEGFIQENVAKDVKPLKHKKSTDNSFSVEELFEFLAAIDRIIERKTTTVNVDMIRTTSALDCLRVLALTGLRPDEVSSLKWLDDGGNYIDLEQQMFVFRDHKTASSTDYADFENYPSTEVWEYISKFKKREGNNYLFPARSGPNQLQYNTLRDAFYLVIEEMHTDNRAELAKRTPYCLRHTFVTFALLNGWTINEVQKNFNHKSLLTTMRYQDKSEALKKRMQSKNKSLLSDAQKTMEALRQN